MKLRKIFSFYIYFIIFGVCSGAAQETRAVSNVSFIRQQLLKKAEACFALPFVEEYDVVVLASVPGAKNTLLNFWQEILAEKALDSGMMVYRKNESRNEKLGGNFLVFTSTLFEWHLRVEPSGKHAYKQIFCCELHVQIKNEKERVLASFIKPDCFKRSLKNRKVLKAVQSSEFGFQHQPPAEKYDMWDFFQTALIAGASLSTVLLLYSFRSQ